MTDESPTSAATSGTAAAPNGNSSPADKLRAAGVAASEGGEKRGRGRPRKDSSQAPIEKKATVIPKPSKTPEFVYTKTGKAFRCLGNLAALNTNCSVWLLSPEEEKDLGESVGDILLELGFTDTMAAKAVFAIGTVLAIGGTKAIQYAQWKSIQPVERVVPTPSAAPITPKPESDPGPSVIPEAKPGII